MKRRFFFEPGVIQGGRVSLWRRVRRWLAALTGRAV